MLQVLTRIRRPLVVLLAVAAFALMVTAGCQNLPPPIAEGLHASIDSGVRQGTFGPEVAAKLHEAVNQLQAGGGLGHVLELLGTGLGSVLLGMLGIRVNRGPAKPMDPETVAALRALVAERRPPLPSPS